MQLKTLPEDFVVAEIARHELSGPGPYLLLEMTKRNLTTEAALDILCRRLGIPRKHLGYAGTKDRRALTRQHITVRASSRAEGIERFSHKDVKLRLLGRVEEPLALGDLEANRFDLVVRKLAPEEVLREMTMIPNYFDAQRFSAQNAQVGRCIVRADYTGAAALLKEEPAVERWLEERPTDAIGALKHVPRGTLLLYVHAYQSLLFNEVLERYILSEDPQALTIDERLHHTIPAREIPQRDIPLLGFHTRLSGDVGAWYEEILEREGIALRSFVIRPIPFLTTAGTVRPALFALKDFAASPREADDLHQGLEKQELSFVLPKAAYATLTVKCLYRAAPA